MKKCFLILLLVFLTACTSPEVRSGLKNYDKNYYITKYKGDLDSNLSIFPESSIVNKGTFISSFEDGLFDSYGFIILKTSYDELTYEEEIKRLSNIEITISETCYTNSKKYKNHIIYDLNSYNYPAYIANDGFRSTYEYVLLNKEQLEIYYIYVAYPDLSNENYNMYLKKDKSVYEKTNLNAYSIYNHSFDQNRSFAEFDDCN